MQRRTPEQIAKYEKSVLDTIKTLAKGKRGAARGQPFHAIANALSTNNVGHLRAALLSLRGQGKLDTLGERGKLVYIPK